MKNKMQQEPVSRLVSVSKTFQGFNREARVLKGIDFAIFPGELVLLLGPSGSGKSTFLTILAGLQPPTSGEVWLFGKELQAYTQATLQELRAAKLGFIFQTFHLIDALTALENILLVMKFTHTNDKSALIRAKELLEQFGILYLIDAYPRTMSQGEKQRVAIARALANNAQLIIADEPTGSLATDQGLEIVLLLSNLAKKENRSVVLTSHDQRIIPYADRVLFLQDGVLS